MGRGGLVGEVKSAVVSEAVLPTFRRGGWKENHWETLKIPLSIDETCALGFLGKRSY